MGDFVQYRNLLADPTHGQDSCGVGFVADISGKKSHRIIELALEAVANLTHRGAVDADAKTGDGAGVLTQLPKRLFKREVLKLGYKKVDKNDIAVGMVFLPSNNPIAKERCKTTVEEVISGYDLTFYGWRKVPIDMSVLGGKALATLPNIYQVLIGRKPGMSDDEYERTLYLARKKIERHVLRNEIRDFYIPSMSHRTIVYKGLFVAPQLKHFYLDLKDPEFKTSLAVFHQRYSTNTFPNWFLAQPFRMLAHNGEINTLRGNVNWIRAREPELSSPIWGEQVKKLTPVIQEGGSDSANLDNVLELIALSGRDIRHALMMLIPEAHESYELIDPDIKGFYEYHGCLSEPWGGPAAVAFTDGRVVGATLDRNGFRPARYIITDDGIIIMASEVGVVNIEQSRIIEKGRLGPGMMIAVDTAERVLLKNDEIKAHFARQKPYRKWVEENIIKAQNAGANTSWSDVGKMDEAELLRLQKAFGYTLEDIERILEPMATNASEPVGSMGDDTPLAVLSHKPRLLYSYFKQRFAQVTNPPVDSLREQIVMSLTTNLGRKKSILEETPEHARVLQFKTPILSNEELKWIKNLQHPEFRCEELPMLFDAAEGPEEMKRALKRLRESASKAVDEGKTILILTDRGVSPDKANIPALLAVSSVHHHLIREGKRKRVSLVVETGDAREDHHFACLIGYGASCVNPYLAFETVSSMARAGGTLSPEKALENYKKAAEKGILKIMSKMGITAVSSYRGAQMFEAVGVSKALVNKHFTGTESRIGGVTITDIARDILAFHASAFDDSTPLVEEGYFRFRKQGEYHALNPSVFKALHKAVRSGKLEDYLEYEKAVEATPPIGIRDLLDFRGREPIPVEEVEPIESIIKRFCAPGMSYGALSKEAHETIAIGMNRLGAKSCSGEGGESRTRFHRRPNGDWPNSQIKQVASGRFGVTPEYLASCREIEIKMAQGSKPGEGGQLPGTKVTKEIAEVRHSVPGVTLISPPPHHDIYSIEDLSQLIYDLKHANTRAKVAVKLVAESGVGTVAAGVAKGYADVVHISGHEGGTGASPLGSMKNAGVPWELGLAESQQILVTNDLRGRVVLRVDGGLKTARDVLIAAMLGAEEYAFGTISMVAVGCVMARQCHLNTCPVGVASQKPELRAKFPGSPDHIVNFYTALATRVRELLASLGFRRMEEIIGRTDLLKLREGISLPKTSNLDLSPILADPDPSGIKPRLHTKERNDRTDAPLDNLILQESMDAIAGLQSVSLSYEIKNTHRTVGAMIAGEIAYRYGDAGLPGVTLELNFRGTAGQSFGAFALQGMRLILEGDANDYVGKGMHGGEIIIKPPRDAKFESHKNVIMGNTVMYGATRGELYAAGVAGERFCVRNSGGIAVVEGIGDHGCEYMTGGIVAILGRTGKNFAAGMTGGIAYVLDEEGTFPKKYNPQHVGISRLQDEKDILILKTLIAKHREATGSKRAEEILSKWHHYLPLFWKVLPFEMERLQREEGGYLELEAAVKLLEKREGLIEEPYKLAQANPAGLKH